MHVFWTTVHILGVVIGAGGAFTSDALFFSSIRDKKLSKTEIRLLKVASTMVWIGIAIILISGTVLFLDHLEELLGSSKFLVKMTVVAVIIINGLFFHYRHLPLMVRTKEKDIRKTAHFRAGSPLLFISGAISVVSWFSAIVLGSLRQIPFTYAEGIGFYILFLVVASVLALLMRKWIMR